MSSPAPTSTERAADRAVPTGRARPRRTVARADGLDRLRILLAGAMGAVLAGYALLVPVAAALLASGGGASLDAAFTVAVPMWLAAQQIPVVVGGQPLGVLPLLPTVVVVVVVALASGRSVRRLGGRLRHDAGAVVASQAGAGAAVAVLAGALLPSDVAVTSPWASMIDAGLVAAFGACLGVLRSCRMPRAWSVRLDGWPRAALAGTRAGLTGLLLAGGLVLLVTLLVHLGGVADSFTRLAPGAGAAAGLFLLALGYLPNALVAAVAWTVGPGIGVGVARWAPFDAVPGPLPPFPLFAALSTEPPPGWAPLVLVLPLVAGVTVGLACRRACGPSAVLRDRLIASGAAAGAVAVVAGVVAGLAGGRLASGPFDPVSLSALPVALATLILLGVPATVTCVGIDEILGRSRRPRARRDAVTGDAARRGGPPRPDGRRPVRSGSRPGPERHREVAGGASRPAPRTVGDLVADREVRHDHTDGSADARTDDAPDTGPDERNGAVRDGAVRDGAVRDDRPARDEPPTPDPGPDPDETPRED